MYTSVILCFSFIIIIIIIISSTWERHYGEVIRWLRVRLAFALVWATNVCVRGSRTKWHSLGLEDGAAVPFDYFYCWIIGDDFCFCDDHV